MWQTIARANSVEELKSTRPTMADLPAGTEVIVRIELPLWAPVGKVADLVGAEWWGRQLAPADMKVIDVYGNWHWMEIRGVAGGMEPFTLCAILAVSLTALGIAYYIASVIITANIVEQRREQAKIEFIREMAPRYGAETVTRWLEGIESPPSGIELPEWALPAGIGIGTVVIIGLVAFLLMAKR